MGKRKIAVILFTTVLLVAIGSVFVLRIPAGSQMEAQQLASQTLSLAKGLEVPWQMTWLPPNKILFTEISGSIKWLNIETKELKPVYQFQDVAREIQSGTLGLALHPDFENKPQVFASYNYYKSEEIQLRVDLLQFEEDSLHFVRTIIDSIPSFAISIGGRLINS